MALSRSAVELVDSDTTVELLAQYIARQLKPQLAGRALQVVAYEGVGKGAIAEGIKPPHPIKTQTKKEGEPKAPLSYLGLMSYSRKRCTRVCCCTASSSKTRLVLATSWIPS